MALSKEFYLEEIKSKYPNSYNEGLKDLPVKDLEDMLDFLEGALGKADGGSIGIEVLFREKNKNGGRIGLKDGLMPEDYLYSMDKDAKGFLIGEDSDKIPEGLPEDYLFKIDDKGKIFIVPTKESEDKRKDVEVEDVEDIIERDTPRVGILSGFSPLAFLRKYLAKKELEAKEENKADGGRVGLFMGGPALEGQALQIYNSMKNYNFTDQEIADALSARGLYTPAGSGTTQPEQVTGIINQQLQTGGGRDDNKTGFGKFGNLDPTTEKTFVKDVYSIDMAAPGAPMTGSFKPTEVTGYKNVNTGIYQTLEGKNINHAGINFKPAFAAVLEALGFGEKNLTDLPYKPGQIAGTFTGKNPLDFFKKRKATIEDINAMNLKAIKDMEAKQRAEEAAKRREIENRIISGGANISGGDGGGNFTTSAGTFAPGDYSDVAGTLADPREKMDFYRDGGLATMFKKKR